MTDCAERIAQMVAEHERLRAGYIAQVDALTAERDAADAISQSMIRERDERIARLESLWCRSGELGDLARQRAEDAEAERDRLASDAHWLSCQREALTAERDALQARLAALAEPAPAPSAPLTRCTCCSGGSANYMNAPGCPMAEFHTTPPPPAVAPAPTYDCIYQPTLSNYCILGTRGCPLEHAGLTAPACTRCKDLRVMQDGSPCRECRYPLLVTAQEHGEEGRGGIEPPSRSADRPSGHTAVTDWRTPTPAPNTTGILYSAEEVLRRVAESRRALIYPDEARALVAELDRLRAKCGEGQ